MANNLRPASSINDLRTQAHMQLSARLESIDLTPLLIRTLGNSSITDTYLAGTVHGTSFTGASLARRVASENRKEPDK